MSVSEYEAEIQAKPIPIHMMQGMDPEQVLAHIATNGFGVTYDPEDSGAPSRCLDYVRGVLGEHFTNVTVEVGFDSALFRLREVDPS